MRTTFIQSLVEAAAHDDSIWLLCGDLGYSVLEPFIERFPDRYINVGVAEQNMTSVAAGLAQTGRKVICYSIGNFNTLRCYEQIRNDVCYHGGDVKVVSVGGGLAYGAQGYTHHAVEDIAAMCALPNMVVLAPGDPVEVQSVTRWMLSYKGPCYLRLGKAGEPNLHPKDKILIPGKIACLREAGDILILSTGGMLASALAVADLFERQGISVGVASCPFVKPFDDEFIQAEAMKRSLIVTLEEHTRFGGLGDAVARVLATKTGRRSRHLPFGVAELALKGIAGTQSYLLNRLRLDPASLVEAIAQHEAIQLSIGQEPS